MTDSEKHKALAAGSECSKYDYESRTVVSSLTVLPSDHFTTTYAL